MAITFTTYTTDLWQVGGELSDVTPIDMFLIVGRSLVFNERRELGHCTKHYTDAERWAIKKNDLLKIAYTEADYVYIVKPVTIEETGGMGLAQRKVTADLKSIIKPGGDRNAVENQPVEFWILSSCSDPELQIGRLYLIMAKDGKIVNEKMNYRLDDQAFVMEFYDRRNRALRLDDRRVGHQMFLMRKELLEGCLE